MRRYLILAAILFSTSGYLFAQDITSRFDTDAEGWIAVNNNTSIPTYFATGGNPGGYISITDNRSGIAWYWQAPDKFLHDVSCAYGGSLSFDLKQSFTIQQTNGIDIILAGGGLTLVFNTSPNPGTTWTSYSVSLIETAGWKKTTLTGSSPSQAEMLSVLSSLVRLQIRGEFSSVLAGGGDRGDLDNVVLTMTRPTATVSGNATICAGSPTMISAVLTGVGPWHIVWSDMTELDYPSSPARHNVNPTVNTTYTVTSVSTLSGACIGTSSGSATVNVRGITSVTAGTQSPCDPATNTYTQQVRINYFNPPALGSLVVNGQSFAITTNPQTVTLVGLTADGNPVDVTASFSDNPGCPRAETALFTAPPSCCTLLHPPTHTQEFPENPAGYNGHISDTGTHSTDTGTHNTDSGTHSTDTGTFSTDMGTHSTQTAGLTIESVPSFVRWTARANGPEASGDTPAAFGLSPDGSMLFVTGGSAGDGGTPDFLTIAYNSDTGLPIWAQRYDGLLSGIGDGDVPGSIAISPDGSIIYVTGGSHGDGLIIAYNSSDGTPLWTRRYLGPASASSGLSSIAVSPDGSKLYLTGGVAGDILTIACNSSDGSLIWSKRYNGPALSNDYPRILLLSSDGLNLYVIGESVASGGPSDFDYLTIAYDAMNGNVNWTKRYDGPSSLGDQPSAAALSPGSETIYITGTSQVSGLTSDYLTIAYNATNGNPIWTKRYDGPASGDDAPWSLTVSPDGSKVFVCGQSHAAATGSDYLTIAYNSVDGSPAWTQRYNGPYNDRDFARAIAIGPDGTEVYVTGNSQSGDDDSDFLTITYRSADGTSTMTKRYAGPVFEDDIAEHMQVSPNGAKLYITGYSWGCGSGVNFDFLTVAYPALVNTPDGTNVMVSPPDATTGATPVTLTFSQVTSAGNTSLTTSSTGPATPSGFALGTPSVYYDLSTTTTFSGNIKVRIDYTGTTFTNESAIQLRHFEGEAWVDVTNSRDPDNNIIFGNVTSLSPFAIFEPSQTSVAYCSFSQGFYGNAGNTFNGQGVLSIIQNLLSASPLGVGKTSVRSLTIPQSAANCIITRLPAGSSSSNLPSDLNATLSSPTCQTSPAIPLQKGKWKNALLGQTVALSLNVRFDPDLASFVLSSSFCTQKALPGPNGLLGDADDVVDPNSVPVTFTIPSSVLNALGSGATVADLLNLANSGLAGQSTNGASLGDINQAVDAINRGFDGCRFVVDCPSSKGAESTATEEESENSEVVTSYRLEQAYPNPFNPETVIIFQLPANSAVKLAIYSVTGQLVRELVNGEILAGRHAISWDGRNQSGNVVAAGMYLYRLVVHGETGEAVFTQTKRMALVK